MDATLSELMARIKEFRDERDWEQFHDPKNLAEAISIEASELLQHFLWHDSQASLEFALNNKDNIKEELADVLIFTLLMAIRLNIDPIDIINKKLCANSKKYPVEKAKGNHRKYTEL